ncbi:MAG: hypothetical protein CMP23_05520 [Rickettsiales bacterium]|nr:hypothetical protein [Rickettsiales bacterium]|tara:strand:+ start:5044 stop:5814 length:771 start_codon:yes stop_codon:yes gene_type:complete
MEVVQLLAPAAVIWFCVSLLWLISLRIRDVSIADIWWGPGFALLAWTLCLSVDEPSGRLGLLAAAMSVWGLRLGLYLGRRNLGHPEDRRYAAMRRATPGFWWVSLFKVFYLQGLLQLVVALPFAAIANSTQAFSVLDLLGFTVLLSGVLVEAIADRQLTAFKLRPASGTAVLREGLWGWSRHPNYFGNALIWLGVGVVAIAAAAPWWTLAGPALMWFLLLRVSGVSMLERTIVDRRPDYRRYMEEVSAFFPWPPGP